VAKDFQCLSQSGRTLSSNLPISNAVGDVYETAVQNGIGADNITGVVQLYQNAS